jgi:hypothetical protein
MTGMFFNLKRRLTLRGIGSLVFLMPWGIGFLTVSSKGAGEDPWLSPAQPNTNLPVLTQVRQVHELSGDEARKQYPVKVQAVVTYFDPRFRTLFIQDETGGSWVYRTYHETNLFAGDLVEVNGASWSVSIYGVAIKPVSIRVVGKAPLPTPKLVTYETMASGKDDGIRSQVQGVVRSMAYQFGLLELGLVAGNDHFTVYVPRFEDHPLPENLLGARVEVSGVCSMKLDARALITGLWYYAPDLESVSILRAPALDPYQEPTQPISSLQRYDSWAAFGERVKIAGVVTHWVPSGRLFLRDETRSVLVDLMQPWAHADSKGHYLDPPAFPALKPGDRIEVVGYRSIRESQFSIVDAEFRLAGSGSPPDARNVLAEAALNQDLDGELISLQARLIEIESRPVGKTTNQVLSLMSGDALFEAELADPGRAVFKAEKNSLVRITGVNTVQTDPSRRARFSGS